MSSDSTIELRPRTAGQVLDDAWRLALADAPLLLAMAGLFAGPAVTALVLLLARPVPDALVARGILPGLAALLLPLTGLGSGACQELFRRRAAGERVRLGSCLRAALRRGPQHAAARALVLLGAGAIGLLVGGLAQVLTGPAFWVAVGVLLLILALPALSLWVSVGTVLPILATGDGRLLLALRDSARDARRQPIRSAAVILSRLPLLLLAVANLFLLIEVGLWVAGSLAGLDTAFLDVQLSPGNPVFLLGLVVLAWLALTPYFEASSFLLHLDNRVRHDGLDLVYRVRALFPPSDRPRVASAVLALVGLLLGSTPATAQDDRLTVVRDVRQGVQQLKNNVKTADPFPRDDRYEKQLRQLYERLPEDPPRPRWFAQALDGFDRLDRAATLRVLADLEEKLALLEDSLTAPPGREGVPPRTPEQIKQFEGAQEDSGAGKSKAAREDKERVRRDDPAEDGPERHAGGGGPGIVAPQTGFGLGLLGWIVLGALALAVLAVALFLFLRQSDAGEPTPAPTTESLPSPDVAALEPDEQSPAELWRRAERLARQGDYLGAVRCLYLAVLTHLHRADLIRYEKTRTNGEYLRQLGTAEGRGGLVEPFRRLTRLVEQKWYGERACAADDYDSCLELASELRSVASGGR